jgi:hypothetical protein
MSKRTTAVLTAAVAIAAAFAALAATAWADDPLPNALTHEHWNGYEALAKSSDATPGASQYKNPPSPICSTATSAAANVATDCEGLAPHNETSIAINPTNANNMIASANDYQLANGGKNETIFSRAHVTFDAGKTWTTVPINFNGYIATGDPAVAFDAVGNAYLATLGFGFGQGSPTGKNADIMVSASTDGGNSWTTATRVASGTGSFGSVGIFNDKEYIAAWGNGNAIVTWSRFNDLQKGAYGGSPIYASVTHDGGKTWSVGVEISGAASFCASFTAGCDQDQNSTPVVAADGSIYVSFLTTRDNSNGRDAYAVVQVDPQTGGRIAGPFKVADLVDGAGDYPVSAFGDTTYQDSVFRTWSAGNLTADPTNAQHLAVSWSDMRNSHLTSTDPYATTTNSDVGVAESFDGGRHWTTSIITAPNDQFMPWATFGPSGGLYVGYFDRSYDPANHKYGFTVATRVSTGGTTGWAPRQVSTALSDPTRDDRWFSGTTVNPAFPHPTSFIGDYSGIAAGPNGIAATWTDLRAPIIFGGRSGSGSNAEFALVH